MSAETECRDQLAEVAKLETDLVSIASAGGAQAEDLAAVCTSLVYKYNALAIKFLHEGIHTGINMAANTFRR